MTIEAVFRDNVRKPFDDDEHVLQSHPLREGAAVPLFGQQDSWDLSPAGVPANYSADSVRVKFHFFDETWNLLARELSMIMLNPNHPHLVAQGYGGRARPSTPRTVVRTVVSDLRALFNLAEKKGLLPSYPNWGVSEALMLIDDLGRTRGGSARTQIILTYRLLIRWRHVLTAGGPSVDPWGDDVSSSMAARYSVPDELRTEPVPPKDWYAVLAASWLYVDKFSEDIFAAKAVTERTGALPKGSRVKTQKTLESWASDPAHKVPIHSEAVVLDSSAVNWTLLGSLVEDWSGHRLTLGVTARKMNPRLDDIAMAKIARGECRRESLVEIGCTRQSTGGTTLPWRDGLTRRELAVELNHLQMACFIVVNALSMMRDSEVQAIKRGAVTEVFGSKAIRSVKRKKDPTLPVSHWWISEPVERAIQILESFSASDEYIFFPVRKSSRSREPSATPGLQSSTKIARFVEHVNRNAERWGLQRIESVITSQRLRRTMAVIAANAVPDGELALALQLKHSTRFAVSNALSSAYGRADERWEKEFRRAQQERTTAEMVDLWHRQKSGDESLHGPGASEVSATLAELEAQHGTHDADIQAHVVNDSTMARLVRSKFSTLRLGTLNHCLGRIDNAQCLSASEKEAGVKPNPTICSPETCKNSFVTGPQKAIWTTEQLMLSNLRKTKGISSDSKRLIDQRVARIQRMFENDGDITND